MSIRARIFFVFVTAVIAGFALLAYWISKDVADRYSESFEEIMVDTANLLAEIITTDMNSGDMAMQELDDAFQRLQLRRFSAQIYELEKTSVDIQVYVTDDKGIVIFDTDNGRAVGEDYSQWNDVHQTLIGKYGARSTRVPGEFPAADRAQQLTVWPHRYTNKTGLLALLQWQSPKATSTALSPKPNPTCYWRC